MNLLLQRQLAAAGDVLTDDDLICRAVEAQTSMVAGAYPIVLIQSDRFQRIVPRVLGIDDMYILPYSTDPDIAGYILAADLTAGGEPEQGEAAFTRLLDQLQAATTPIFFQILDPIDTDEEPQQ